MNMNKLFNGQKLMDRFFRKVDNVCWDMSTGQIGLMTEEGIATIEGKGTDAQIAINPFDAMGMGVPAFAQNTPIADVKVGDLISTNRLIGWVTKKTAKQVTLMRVDGTSTTWTPPKTKMLDFASGVMVVRGLTEMFGGGASGASGLAGLQGMMPMMMMMGDDIDMDKMMPMMLMSQMGSLTGADGTDATNPMSGMAQMLPMMMMTQMMGSKNGGNSDSTGYPKSKLSSNFFDGRNV